MNNLIKEWSKIQEKVGLSKEFLCEDGFLYGINEISREKIILAKRDIGSLRFWPINQSDGYDFIDWACAQFHKKRKTEEAFVNVNLKNIDQTFLVYFKELFESARKNDNFENIE